MNLRFIALSMLLASASTNVGCKKDSASKRPEPSSLAHGGYVVAAAALAAAPADKLHHVGHVDLGVIGESPMRYPGRDAEASR